jgi:ferrochelatase
MTPEVAKNVKDYNPDKVVLLPLYPQYSTATTESSIEQWFKSAKNINLKKQTNYICCYPTQKTFLKAHVELIKNKTSSLKNFRLLFSAHGLPEVTIKKGDPYQWQIEKTVGGVVSLLGDVDYTICYQSRVGPLKWIGPSTPEAIDKAIKDDVEIVVVPIAFVSDHSETLVELDIEYREYAKQKGFNKYNVVPALNLNETFIKALYELVISSINSDKAGNIINKICPATFKKCKNKNVI